MGPRCGVVFWCFLLFAFIVGMRLTFGYSNKRYTIDYWIRSFYPFESRQHPLQHTLFGEIEICHEKATEMIYMCHGVIAATHPKNQKQTSVGWNSSSGRLKSVKRHQNNSWLNARYFMGWGGAIGGTKGRDRIRGTKMREPMWEPRVETR